MKYIQIKNFSVIINLLTLIFLISGNAIAKTGESAQLTNKEVLKPPTLRPPATSSPVKPTSPIIIPAGGSSGIKHSTGPITGSSEGRSSGNSSPSPSLSPGGNSGIDAIGHRLPSMKRNADYSIKEPLWVDTENTIGPKVFVDLNSQYYYGWGQVYTAKYTDRMGKTEYVQIELKGLRGNRAAILSVDLEYKNIYEIPINRKYKPMTPDKAIYNSSRIILNNTQKPTCPEYKCIIKK